MTGSLSEDYAALRHGCGLIDLVGRSAVGRLALGGADRQRFLNGQVTCDVKSLIPGTGAYGFFTSPQGKILADVAVLVREDRIWLELPPGRAEEIAAHLRKYIIVDRVEVRPLDDLHPLTLIGPRAGEALRAAGISDLPEEPWSHGRVPDLGEEGVVVRQDGLGASAWTLWTATELAEEWRRRLLGGSVRPVGAEALEVLRAEAGIPRYGVDFGAENFPQETGLEERAVSYTKGCYLGQEVVARIHFRGGVHKGLAGLVFAGGAGVPLGAKLLYEEKEVGRVTTAVDSPALGRPIGLAILHRRAMEPGTRLEIARSEGEGESGGQAEVHPLPFVPAASLGD